MHEPAIDLATAPAGTGVDDVGGQLLLTVEQAAAKLALGRTKLYELIADGRLTTVAIGRSRRVPLAAVEAFVDELVAGTRRGVAPARQDVAPPMAARRARVPHATQAISLFEGTNP